MVIPFKRILENRRKRREDRRAREIYIPLISDSLDRVRGQLDAYSDEELKRRILGIIEDYKDRVSQAKGLDELSALPSEIGYISITLGNPQIIDAFFNTGVMRLEDEVPDYLGTYMEAGGKIVPHIYYDEDGRKVLALGLRKTADGTRTRIKILESLVEDEIGKWHSHPSGIPIPSASDFNPFSTMDIGTYPHLIATIQEPRLYINEFLGRLVADTLRSQLVPYSTEDRERELRGNGYNGNHPQLEFNLFQPHLFYLLLRNPALK